MKTGRSILAFIFMALFQNSFAQTDTVHYYLSADQKPAKGDLAIYHVLVYKEKLSDPFWKKETHFKYDNSLYSIAYTSDAAGLVNDGDFMSFLRDGKDGTAGKYVNNKKDGEWKEWHLNGKINKINHYSSGKMIGTNLSWNSSGKITDSTLLDENGNGSSTSWYDEGTVRSKGNYKNGQKSGLWEYYYATGTNKSMEVNFETDSIISSKCYTEKGEVQNGDCIYEREAFFPGADKGWRDFLIRNLSAIDFAKYMWRTNYYQVILKFVVQSDGTLTDIEVENPGNIKKLEKLAVTILKLSPNWIPAVQYNRPVRAFRRQPITFVTQ